MACQDCGDPDASVVLGGVEVCDRCYDRRVAEIMGLPRLGDPPPPLVLAGPDGRSHRLGFRLWRAGTGIEVQLKELDVPIGEGYQFAVLGDHDADVAVLVEQMRGVAEAGIGRCYLEGSAYRGGWVLRDDEVAGRLLWNDEGESGKPYDVVVDGRTLSWEELGNALEPFEGWCFRLVIEDRVQEVSTVTQEARTDAKVIELRSPRARPRAGE